MFEVIEDAVDGNRMDHDWKDYLGAGISGAFGSLGGNFIQQIVFNIAGGMTDAWLSGDLEQNGLWKTIGSIRASFVASYVFGTTSKFISNKIQINKLTNNKYLNKSLVEKLAIIHLIKMVNLLNHLLLQLKKIIGKVNQLQILLVLKQHHIQRAYYLECLFKFNNRERYNDKI